MSRLKEITREIALQDIQTLYRNTAYWMEQNDLTLIVEAYFGICERLAFYEGAKDNGWNPVTQPPKSGQEVLVLLGDDQDVDLVTYYRKGAPLSDEGPSRGDTGTGRLLDAIFQPPMRYAEADGFYLYDTAPDGYNKWRRHADIITHWQPVPAPPKKTRCKRDGQM
ncbi:MAG: hypothetical protein LBS36_07615 [Oscillospiraceae bacterium]|jgi:hypothetical protein|nr:hypothetical protein [Oscillospiraceae bacterium]